MDKVAGRISIEQAAGSLYSQSRTQTKRTKDSQISFDSILQQKRMEAADALQASQSGHLRFSKHADARLSEREIYLSENQLQRLEDGARIAGEKGIKDSLVIMDNLSFIINTQNNMVITAMDRNDDKESVYTNIDGAVVI